jgi:hypothetical protein
MNNLYIYTYINLNLHKISYQNIEVLAVKLTKNQYKEQLLKRLSNYEHPDFKIEKISYSSPMETIEHLAPSLIPIIKSPKL